MLSAVKGYRQKARPIPAIIHAAWEASNQGIAGDKQRADFEKDLLENIVPFVQTNYRVYTDRDHRALIGLSMGGGQALAIGLHHLDLFSRVAGFSAAVGRTDTGGPYADVAADPKKMNSLLKLLWMGCANEDSLFKPNQDLSAYFKSKGITHTFHPTGGAHTWSNWRKYLAEVAPQLWPVAATRTVTGR